ncbi:hypothetical protein, conserved [Leishmania lindenbergi]|uniref:Uncharacterized protein n=1 Tax=Leishmania lindenbergi TaxID=651832 RepID=A0AAW3A642_9TRYP
MGGAPSRETLVRHIVRDSRVQGSATPIVGHFASGGATNAGDLPIDVSTATPQQPEIVLIPLIPDYFPSSASPLFQQLLQVRREPNVAYYYRDARSLVTEHTVVRDQIGSEKDIYSWYMSLSEQRLLETDNELIALSRARRVVSPVPCAVAFVYEARAAVAVATAAGGAVTSTTGMSSPASSVSGSKKRSGRNSKAHRHGKTGSASASNGYMTIENTVRLPHHNLRVRIFGFVGDTRFCPPSLHPNQAAKLPLCLTIFLSKSAGGNHRTQVTLLAAHTYITQMQDIGILRPYDEASHVGGVVVQSAMTQAGLKANVAGREADPLAALRLAGAGGAADAYHDPYVDPYGTDLAAMADPYAVAGDDGDHGIGPRRQLSPHMTSSVPQGGSMTHLEGLGTTSISSAADVAKETVLRRPIEIVMHRADVPALCYLRELRARMDQNTTYTTGAVCNKESQVPMPSSYANPVSTAAMMAPWSSLGASNKVSCNSNASSQKSCAPNKSRLASAMDAHADISTIVTEPRCDPPDVRAESLKFQIQTVICADELRGSVGADSIGRVLLWASRFYTGHFEQLVGGEAAKLRQELAQRNLTESPLDGALLLTDEEPRPPKVTPKVGDVWIPSNEAYVEVHDTDREVDGWEKVATGTVLRYVTSAPTASSTTAPAAFWRVSANEFAEDILLSLCRQACQASRRAPPTDSHWFLNRKTGMPEGLGMGLLIWRDLCAGQVVFYGTTPEFLKKWIQSGTEVKQAYRDLVKRSHSSEEAASAAEAEPIDATAAREGDTVAVVQSSSMAVAATTATPSGLHCYCGGSRQLNPSGAFSWLGKSASSGGGRGTGPDPSSVALYKPLIGFVSTSGQAAAISSPASFKESSNHVDDGAQPKRVRTDDQPRVSSSSTPPVAVGNLAQPRDISGTPRQDFQLGRLLPAHQRPQLSIPGVSSTAMGVWTHSSSALGTPSSYMAMSLAAASMDSRSNSASLTYRQPSQHVSPLAAAATRWIGVLEATPADDADASTVNVVVRRNRSVRVAPNYSATVGSTPLHTSQMPNSPYHYHTPRCVPSILPVSTQPTVVGATAEASAEYKAQTTDSTMSLPSMSMTARIPGGYDSCSKDVSLRQGGHSPTSIGQGRFPRAEGELLFHSSMSYGAAGLSDARRPPPPRSAAVTVWPSHGTDGSADTLLQAASSAKWNTASAGPPSSMRGSSITFASGSASSAHARHVSLLHSTRYAESCQSVASRSSSLSTSELLGPRVCLNGLQLHQRESLRPLPLLGTAEGDDGSTHALQHTPVLQSSADLVRQGGEMATVPYSCYNSVAHTPHQSDLMSSAKSSVGSGKYRWDWRGVFWAV